jgi:HK97 gp10 family phage protein
MEIELKVDRRLEQALRSEDKAKRVLDAVRLNTAEMQRASARNVPVVTGNLKRSQQIEIDEQQYKGTVRFTADYAEEVEFGTRMISPRRYLGRAYEAQVGPFVEDVKKAIRAKE